MPSRKSRACNRTGLDNVVLPIEIAKKRLRGNFNLFPVKDGERTIGGGGANLTPADESQALIGWNDADLRNHACKS